VDAVGSANIRLGCYLVLALYEISYDEWLGVIPTFEKEQTVLDVEAKLGRKLVGGDLDLSTH